MSSEGIWFLDSLVYIRAAAGEGQDGLSAIEHRAPFGSAPPLHVHHTEDELFHIFEGELRFVVAGRTLRCGPGTVLLAPKGVPHTYRVESSAGVRMTTVTARGDFERMVRAVGRPAERDELPPPSGPPSPEALARLAATTLQYGIEIVGPPLELNGAGGER